MLKNIRNRLGQLLFERKYCVYIVSNKDQTRLRVLMSERKVMLETLRCEIVFLNSDNYVLYQHFFASEDKAESHWNILQRLPLNELVLFISRHNPDWKMLLQN